MDYAAVVIFAVLLFGVATLHVLCGVALRRQARLEALSRQLLAGA